MLIIMANPTIKDGNTVLNSASPDKYLFSEVKTVIKDIMLMVSIGPIIYINGISSVDSFDGGASITRTSFSINVLNLGDLEKYSSSL